MKKILDKINAWLESEEKDLQQGADLLLSLNRNRILHRSIIQRKNLEKLLYEMNRQRIIYEGRVSAHADQVEINAEFHKLSKKEQGKKIGTIVSQVKTQEDPEKAKGMRADHEKLPAEKQQLYKRNSEIYPRMRAVHEKIKVLKEACDRKPYINELLELDDELRSNWESYDKAEILEDNSLDDKRKPLTANQVSAARKYLSDNKPKLADLITSEDKDKIEVLRSKMQERLTNLLLDGQEVDEKHLQELIDLGLTK